MTLQQLYYAITISEVGSLNKAAEILYVAQPSLSAAVHELEEELGIRIFHRSGRGVSLTNDGVEFLTNARLLYQQYESIREKYSSDGKIRKKFGVSAQHYSFAVKTFVETVKQLDTKEYEFAIRETKTREVIEDVSTLRSEIGILYLDAFNKKMLQKIFSQYGLEFHKLIDCCASVYLWNGHPLAGEKEITPEQLEAYPCLSFEQGGNSSLYFAEELRSQYAHPRVIKACDRATMLNLMIGLHGYTLCSGFICEELNGSDYCAIPLKTAADDPDAQMELGYIIRKKQILSPLALRYIKETKRYLNAAAG